METRQGPELFSFLFAPPKAAEKGEKSGDTPDPTRSGCPWTPLKNLATGLGNIARHYRVFEGSLIIDPERVKAIVHLFITIIVVVSFIFSKKHSQSNIIAGKAKEQHTDAIVWKEGPRRDRETPRWARSSAARSIPDEKVARAELRANPQRNAPRLEIEDYRQGGESILPDVGRVSGPAAHNIDC